MEENLIAIIPVRAGSKRLVGKNSRQFLGKPLFAHTVEAAIETEIFSEIILTTDDESAISYCELNFNKLVTVLRRDPQLASDQADTVSVILEATSKFSDDALIVLLQVTSPLRNAQHIRDAYFSFCKNIATSLVSITPIKGNSNWLLTVENDGSSLRRYENVIDSGSNAQMLYLPNGAIYIVSLQILREQKEFLTPNAIGFIMPFEVSVDIDTIEDFELAQWLKNVNQKEIESIQD